MTARDRRGDGGALLTLASVLLLLLATAQGYVSFRAQYTFVNHAKHSQIPSTLEALGLDTGAVIFALLALSLARRGRHASVERVLNVACAVGSLTMNLLAADLTSPRSVTVWVMPSALYALASDRLIAVVRRWAQSQAPAPDLGEDGSAWRALGGCRPGGHRRTPRPSREGSHHPDRGRRGLKRAVVLAHDGRPGTRVPIQRTL